MAQRIQNTDAFILMQFSNAVAHLRNLPADQAMQSEILRIGSKYLDQLKANGHEWQDAISLMRAAFAHNPPSKEHATPQPGVYSY